MRQQLSIFILVLFSTQLFSQEHIVINENDSTNQYPYTFPIWGDKLEEKGIDFPLPAGISLHYVYNEMYLGISEFGMGINGTDLSSILNEQTLGFQTTRAYSNGINLRGDLFTLPFLNFYGLFSYVEGGTEVALQPDFGMGAMPLFKSSVVFNAISFGGGMTFNYGYKDYFFSADVNYSGTRTDLLENEVNVVVSSFRIGKKFNLKKKDRFVNFYVGAMYRNFVSRGITAGVVQIKEVLPDLDDHYNIWYNQLTPIQQRLLDKTIEGVNEEYNLAIGEGGVMNSTVDYYIKKDLIKKWTFQFGGQFQLSKRIWIRGEYGVSDYSKFIMTGINYRFGI
ncbi:hypothetical protein [Flammeovirga sp. SJP92]|uniref:hypothetical protein n=1 Tax=Flammeovirga sp. SJP92 TaxID=1775430 RepID=UPI0007896900|nr:hypothetical protein [Flammeovirga sp. SJP92]KXX69169.1 hypothetical protein AVL50_16735 [Flammeovirga sp. SJP92]